MALPITRPAVPTCVISPSLGLPEGENNPKPDQRARLKQLTLSARAGLQASSSSYTCRRLRGILCGASPYAAWFGTAHLEVPPSGRFNPVHRQPQLRALQFLLTTSALQEQDRLLSFTLVLARA
jgi:hypothetical protein